MTTRNRPNYGIYYILLTAAGSMDLPIIGTRVALIGAYSNATITFAPGGGQQLTGGAVSQCLVGVQIGKALGDVLPFGVGNKVRVDNKFDFVRLTWAAQIGITAVIAISDDADGNGIEFDAPPSVTVGQVFLQSNSGGVAAFGPGADNLNTLRVGISNDFVSGGTVQGGAGVVSPQTPRVVAAWDSFQIGSSSFSNSSTATGATTLLSAASNVNGVTVKAGASIFGGAGTNELLTGTVAPTSLTSNPALLVCGANYSILPQDIYLPPGQGLYIWSSAGSGTAYGNYTVH